MNLRILLESFLGLMREDGELDKYLPLLLSAMGHQVVFRPSKGPRQFGVDLVTTAKDSRGKRTLNLWLIKCGDVDRTAWRGSDNAVRESIEEVGDIYLRTHIPPQFHRSRKCLHVVTNGEFRQAITQDISQYLEAWTARYKCDTKLVSGSTLADWTEQHLLDENILPSELRGAFRRTLVNVASPEICLQHGRPFVRGVLSQARSLAGSPRAQNKRKIQALRALSASLAVLFAWGKEEGNLLAPYRLAEFALLAVWVTFRPEFLANDKGIGAEFGNLLNQFIETAATYHSKLGPYYFVRNAFCTLMYENLLVTEKVFEEAGRLGVFGSMVAWEATVSSNEDLETLAILVSEHLKALLNSHSCSGSPCYDYQASEIHCALLLLMATNNRPVAEAWVATLIQRLHYAAVLEHRRFWPVDASFDDAIAMRSGAEEVPEDIFHVSTIVPVLAIWAAVLGMAEGYAMLRDQVAALLPQTSLNLWSPDAGFEECLSDPNQLHEHGVAEPYLTLPTDPQSFLASITTPLSGLQGIESMDWYQKRMFYFPLMASLHWRLQIPREMIAKHAIALATRLS